MQYQNMRIPAGRTHINLLILPGCHFESPSGGVEPFSQDGVGNGNIHAAYFYDRELAHLSPPGSVIGALRRTAREDSAAWIMYLPAGTFQLCVSSLHAARVFRGTFISICLCSPGCRLNFAKPLSCEGGS